MNFQVVFYSIFVFLLYDNVLKDLPFRYITQTKYQICKNSFCTRFAYFVISIVTYLVAVNCGFYKLENRLITTNIFNPFMIGSFIGIILPIVDFVVSTISGFIKITKLNNINFVEIWQIFLNMFLTSVTEEIIYRGILIGFMIPYVPVWISLIFSSLVFSYGHLQYSWMYALAAFSGGIILGIAFIQYGIYCSIGIHLFFNFMETFLYSIFVINVKNKLMAGERKTPDDGGVLTFLVEVCFLAIFFIVIRKNKILNLK